MSRSLADPDTRTRQLAASDPDVSAWVSANAGAGKTTVLRNRVLRLLLRGVDPGRILCLTFTKAAAAEMSNRVFAELARWVGLDDDGARRGDRGNRGRGSLGGADQRGAPPFRARHRDAWRLARRHHPRILHAPASGFRFRGQCAGALRGAGGRASPRPHGAGAACGPFLGDFRKGSRVVGGVVARRRPCLGERFRPARRSGARLANMEDGCGARARFPVSAPRRPLRRARDRARLDVERDRRRDLVARASGVRAARLRRLGSGKRQGSRRARRSFRGSQRSIPPRASRPTRHCFSPKTATRKSCERRKNLASAAARKADPGLEEALHAEALRLLRLLDRRRALETRERSLALFALVGAIRARFAKLKSERAALDFDDLIAATRRLLVRASAAFVLYKLDAAIEHLLVDEAQDTNFEYWAILRALTSEFTAGSGARSGRLRTVFAVGDEKQSIYGFQGAEPRIFGEMRDLFAKDYRALALEEATSSIGRSRSTCPSARRRTCFRRSTRSSNSKRISRG